MWFLGFWNWFIAGTWKRFYFVWAKLMRIEQREKGYPCRSLEDRNVKRNTGCGDLDPEDPWGKWFFLGLRYTCVLFWLRIWLHFVLVLRNQRRFNLKEMFVWQRKFQDRNIFCLCHCYFSFLLFMSRDLERKGRRRKSRKEREKGGTEHKIQVKRQVSVNFDK